MNNLQKWFSSIFPRKHPSQLLRSNKDAKLTELIARYNRTENAEEKNDLLEEICARFPRTLFLASVCFPGDDPNAPVHDRNLYGSAGAKNLYEENRVVIMNGNPGYRLAKKDTDKRVHLRVLVGKTSGQSFIPLFTDFTKLTPVFGLKTRVALFTIREVKAMCERGQGILINPGENPLIFGPEDLWRIK